MRRTLPILTIVAGLCFVGLMVVQYLWINKVIDANRVQFRSRVEVALKEAASGFRQESLHKEKLRFASAKNQSSIQELIKEDLHHAINKAFQLAGLNLNFHYAVYNHVDDARGNRLDYIFGNIKFRNQLPICTQAFDPASQSYQVPLTCNFSQNSALHIAVALPTQNQYLFATLLDSLVASIAFTTLLMALFTYFLYKVYQQKKLARIKDDFINNLTHEFKTPLFSIGLATRLLKRDEAIAVHPSLSRYIGLIETEKARLESQVNKILQMAMVDSGNFVLDKKSVDIHRLVEVVVRDFALAIQEKGGRVVLNLEAVQPIIQADEVHVKNTLFSMLDNALKYSHRSPQINIMTRNTVFEGKNCLAIIIADNGIGMAEEVKQNIFSKFYRGTTGDIHNVKGFGLGMSYVQSIIHAHKGRISVESALGKGSTFYITLPIS